MNKKQQQKSKTIFLYKVEKPLGFCCVYSRLAFAKTIQEVFKA